MKFFLIITYFSHSFITVNNQPPINNYFTMDINPQTITRIDENHIQIQINDQTFKGRIIHKHELWIDNLEEICFTNYKYIVTNQPIIVSDVALNLWYNFEITDKPITGLSYQGINSEISAYDGLPHLTTEVHPVGTRFYTSYFGGELFLVKYDVNDLFTHHRAVIIWILNSIVNKQKQDFSISNEFSNKKRQHENSIDNSTVCKIIKKIFKI